MKERKKFEIGACHRGASPERRLYDAEKAALWRGWVRNDGLKRHQVAKKAGVSESTVDKAFQEY